MRVVEGIGQNGLFHITAIAFFGGAISVDGLEVLLGAGVAGDLGIESLLLYSILHSDLIGFGQRIAFLCCSIAEGIGGYGCILGRVQEVVCPGLTGCLVCNLLIQRLADIQTKDGCIGAALRIEIVDSVHIVVVQLCIAEIISANGHGNRVLLTDTGGRNGFGNADRNSGHYHNRQSNNKKNGVQSDLPGFLLLGQLPFGHFGSVSLAALLFLAGCTHVIKSSHFILVVNLALRHRLGYYKRLFRLFQGGNSVFPKKSGKFTFYYKIPSPVVFTDRMGKIKKSGEKISPDTPLRP